MFCPHCGSPDQDFAFCRTCGAATGNAPRGTTATEPVGSSAWQAPEAGTPAASPSALPPPPDPPTGVGGLPRPPDALPAQYAVYGTQPLTDYRASSGVGKWATALFWVVCGLGALSIGFAIWQMTAFNQWWDSPTGSVSGMAALDDLLDAEESLEAVRTVFFATALPAAVLLIIYTFQVARHLVRARGATRLRLTEGWAIGGWFVPLANTVLPFLFLSDLDRMSGSDNHPLGTSWRGRSVTGWLWIWWLSIAATLIAGAVRDSVDLDLVDHDGMQTYLSSEIAQQVAVTLAALGMAMYLRRLRRQVDRGAQVHVRPAPPSS